jgi:hypothetical protein
MPGEEEQPGSDLDRHVVPEHVVDRRNGRRFRRMLVRQPVQAIDDPSGSCRDDRLSVAEVATQHRRVTDPRAMLIIEQEPVDREALRTA